MASKEDINNQKELNKEMDNTKSAARGVNEEIGSLYDQLRGVTSELKGQANEVNKSRSAFRSFEKAAQDLKLQQEGINRLTDDQVKKLNENLIKQQAIANQEAERLLNNTAISSKISEIQQEIEEGNLSLSEGNESLIHQISLLEGISEEEKAILASRYDSENAIDKIVNQAQSELNVRKDVNKAMGVSGGILKGLNEVGGSFAQAFKLNEVVDDMEEFADESIRAEGSVSRLSVLGVGMKSAFTNVFKTLTDPSVIITNLIKGFTAVDKQAVSFQRMTGQNMNTLATSADAANTHFITMADYIKTAGELTAELGMNANNILSPSDIQEASEMAHAMGMTGDEAAKITKISTTNGKSLRENNEAIVDSVNSFNKQNKTAVMASKVFKDIANVSDEIAILYTGYPEKLASAAAAANSIGMELGDVANIASNLLNFESSIGAELEAELITGQALNLEKARSLAMSNDLEGLAKEIANQGITSASFAALGAKGQAAQAKALGMSTAQMSKMLIQQGLTVGMSEEGLSDAQKQELSLMKQEEAQEKITKAIEKMQQVFAPIVEVVADVLTGFLGIVSGAFQLLGYLGLAKPVMFAIVGAIAISKFKAMATAAGEFKDNLKDGLKMAGDLGKKIFGVGKNTKDAAGSVTEGAQSKLKDAVTGGTGKAAEATGKAAKAGSAAKPGMGKQIQGLLTGLSKGLKQMAGKEVFKGALNLIPAALGFTAMTAGAVGLAAIALFGKPAEFGLKGLGKGLVAFGKAMSQQTPIGPVILVAPAALALLGAAMIPFALALRFAAPALEAIGSIISSVFTGIGVIITSVAEGFTMFLGAITFEKAAALPLVGIGLVALAAGVVAMAAVTPFLPLAALSIWGLSWALEPLTESMAALGPNLQMISTGLVSLTGIAPTLFSVANGLGAISSGLSSMAVSGFMALPIIGALTALGTVSGALGSIFGGGEESSSKDDGSLKKVEEKLDQLISIVSAGGDVYIDGSKVGKTLQLASSKMG